MPIRHILNGIGRKYNKKRQFYVEGIWIKDELTKGYDIVNSFMGYLLRFRFRV